jgi:hypothetical protein
MSAPDCPNGVWRGDVAMPPRVAALPRTPGGIPITYTVAWTSERKVELRPDPLMARLGYGETLAIFADGRPGDGTPKLAITETSRQRRAALLGLCQVCAHPIPEPTKRRPRWLADLRKNGQTIKLDGRILPLIIDTWTCTQCMAYALQACPGLIRRRAETPPLRLLAVRAYRLIATLERPDSIPDHELPGGAIGLVKIAPTDFNALEVGDFPPGARPMTSCSRRRIRDEPPEQSASDPQ